MKTSLTTEMVNPRMGIRITCRYAADLLTVTDTCCGGICQIPVSLKSLKMRLISKIPSTADISVNGMVLNNGTVQQSVRIAES